MWIFFSTPESLKFVCRWLLGKPTRSEDYTKDKNPCTPDGFSVMHLAAANGKTNVMKILIRNEENKNPPAIGNGWTPLHLAAQFAQLNMHSVWFERYR